MLKSSDETNRVPEKEAAVWRSRLATRPMLLVDAYLFLAFAFAFFTTFEFSRGIKKYFKI
jgi:hypothetical protein